MEVFSFLLDTISLALILISSQIQIVLVSDFQKRKRLFISFELSGDPFKIYNKLWIKKYLISSWDKFYEAAEKHQG